MASGVPPFRDCHRTPSETVRSEKDVGPETVETVETVATHGFDLILMLFAEEKTWDGTMIDG